MGTGDSYSITVKVMYCKDLKSFNFFQKLLLYVVVSIVSDDPARALKQKLEQRTPTDKDGDGNPEWYHELQLDLNEVPVPPQDSDHLFLHFDIKHEGQFFGDKTIGEVRVPLKDVIDDVHGIVRFVTYEVRTPDGKPNGLLNFSYKVDRKGKHGSSVHETPGNTNPIYPVVHHHHQSPENQYPTSSGVENTSSEVHYPSVVELEGNSQAYYPQVQENLYSPPDTYYRPTPPPLSHGPPPPPPPMVHGACCPPPPPPPIFHHWPPDAYAYGPREHWRPPAGMSWRADFRGLRDHPSSFWNGR